MDLVIGFMLWKSKTSMFNKFDGTVVDAVSVIGEYLNEEPWLKLLCGKLKYSLQLCDYK